MNQQVVPIEKGTFKSIMVPIAAILFTVAAVSGAAAVGTLFHPASIPAIIHDMELGQIYDTTAQRTWLVVYIVTTVVNCIGTLVLSLSMLLVLLRQHYKGTNLLFYSAKWALPLVTVSGAALLPYFIYRAVRYIVIYMNFGIENAMVPLYAMVLSEGLMLALSWFVFVKLRRFLNCSMDTAASMGYTLSSGKLKAPSIPAFTATGFLAFGVFDVIMAMDRFLTFIHRQINYVDHFYFPFTKDPVQFLSGLSFAFAAVGSILLYFYLHGYKSKSELLLMRSFKDEIKN